MNVSFTHQFKLSLRLLAVCLILVVNLAASRANADGVEPNSANAFVADSVLPPTMKRVLVLPLAHEESRPDLRSGCETLTPVLQSELIKLKKFEVVTVSPTALESLTGQLAWTGAEALPTNFFNLLKQTYGCDGVLFCELTAYRAYAPLSIGWRLKLVDLADRKIIWASDMLFDASDAAIRQEVKDFQKKQKGSHEGSKSFFRHAWAWLNRDTVPEPDQPWAILNSPRLFGRFSIVQVLQTMPKR